MNSRRTRPLAEWSFSYGASTLVRDVSEIVEDMGLPMRIHELEAVHEGDACVYIHVMQRVLETRDLITKIDKDDVQLLIAEEALFLVGLRNSRILTQEQFQYLNGLLHGNKAA